MNAYTKFYDFGKYKLHKATNEIMLTLKHYLSCSPEGATKLSTCSALYYSSFTVIGKISRED